MGFDGRTVSSLLPGRWPLRWRGKNVRFAYEQDLAGAVAGSSGAVGAAGGELPAECAGLTREEKLHLLREKMRETGAEVLVLTALDEVAWTLNLRGDDVRCTPVFLSFPAAAGGGHPVCAGADPVRRAEGEAGGLRRALASVSYALLDIIVVVKRESRQTISPNNSLPLSGYVSKAETLYIGDSTVRCGNSPSGRE